MVTENPDDLQIATAVHAICRGGLSKPFLILERDSATNNFMQTAIELLEDGRTDVSMLEYAEAGRLYRAEGLSSRDVVGALVAYARGGTEYKLLPWEFLMHVPSTP